MPDSQPLRLSILGIVALALFAALFSRLWFLQVMAVADYQAVGDSNRTRTIVVEGPRGRIFDRNGVVLAANRESVVVTVDTATWRAADDPDAVLTTLVAELTAAGIDSSVEQVRAAINGWNGDPYRPVVVAEDVGDDLYITLSERATVLPGVGVEKHLVRHYPNGTLAAHVLGYTGEINEQEMEARAGSEKAYQLGDSIGKSGVEQQYEPQLRGTPGSITFEVNSMGVVVSILRRVEPQPGMDLWLTLDADLQAIAEESLAEEMQRARSRTRPVPAPAGSAVVEAARTGEVLAMASYPTFDPNELVKGVSTERWNQLGGPECKPYHCPMSNRAIREPYAVGSTFKVFTAYAAATLGLRSPGELFDDRGTHTLNPCTAGQCTFSNAGDPYPSANGTIDMRTALTVSSNVYFFSIGERFARNMDTYGRRPIQQTAELFGMGSATGIALPNETSGILIDPDLKAQRHEDNPEAFPYGRWEVGDTVNLAIGQGDIGVTPLQLANAYAAMGNGGTVWNPNIALRLTDPSNDDVAQEFGPRQVRQIELDQGVRQVIMEGLVGVTSNRRGTGYRVFDGFPLDRYPVAGKTGTAQVLNRTSSSVFAAWAPAANPEYAVTVLVEQGGYGSSVAAPVARRILEPLAYRSLDGTPLVEAAEVEVEAGGSVD